MSDLFKQRLGLSFKLIWNIYTVNLYRPNRWICSLRNKIVFAVYVNNGNCHLAHHFLSVNSFSTDCVSATRDTSVMDFLCNGMICHALWSSHPEERNAYETPYRGNSVKAIWAEERQAICGLEKSCSKCSKYIFLTECFTKTQSYTIYLSYEVRRGRSW